MRTEATRRKHIEAWKVSGLSKAAYARENGINVNTFHSWFHTQQEASQNGTGFIEISPKKNLRGGAEGKEEQIMLVLENGYRLVVPNGYEAETLSSLIDLLEAR
jgi:transposase-like protein